MSDYRLQFEISDQEKREISLQSEKWELETKIQEQKDKIRKIISDYLKVSSWVILVQALFAFFFQDSMDFFFLVFLSIINSAVLGRFFYVLKKQEKKRDELNTTFVENRLEN